MERGLSLCPALYVQWPERSGRCPVAGGRLAPCSRVAAASSTTVVAFTLRLLSIWEPHARRNAERLPRDTAKPAGWLSGAASGGGRLGIGAGRQVPLVPGDPEHTVALRACQVGGMTLHRRPRAAHRAHHISVAPAARHVAGVAGTRHDGPAKRTPEDRFDQPPRHGHGLGCDLQDRLRSGHLDDAIPPPASQPAVHVHAETGPGDRQFLDGALHGGLHRPCHAGQP